MMLKYHYKSALPAYKAHLNLADYQEYGLYGGSFNPVHQGHLSVVKHVYEALDIKKVICLVTPNNPFKDPSIYQPYSQRLTQVKDYINLPYCIISDLENQIKTRNTYETLEFLIRRYPKVKFTYIIGSDSLSHIHRWHFFRNIVHMVKFAIIVRSTHRFNIRSFKAIDYFNQHNIAYKFILKRFHKISSSDLRALHAPY